MADIQDKILVNLPYLRRYAGMLTGSKERGDEYVRACLEAIVAEPESVQQASDVSVELFGRFHRARTSLDSVAPADAKLGLGGRVQRHLAWMPFGEGTGVVVAAVGIGGQWGRGR